MRGVSRSTLEVRNLTKRFGAVTAVDDLSFSVQPGTVTGFLGPNGAGKTTTLRILLGLVRASAGVALVNGVPYERLPEPARTVGAVLESSGFHPARSGLNHLRTIAITAGIRQSRVGEVLELVGLAGEARRRVGGYSMGMRQRLEIARALLGDPAVLVLDEPANGLDPQGIAWLRSLLRYLAGEGKLVLISSHLLAEAAQTVDDVVILSQGRLAAQGRLSELLQAARSTVRVRALEPGRLLSALAASGVEARLEGRDLVVAEAVSPEEVGRLIADRQLVVTEMSSTRESLEDLFFEMTEGTFLPSTSLADR